MWMSILKPKNTGKQWQSAVNQLFTPKGKNCSPASEVNDRFATNQNDISVKLQSLYESNTNYVSCFEVIYTTQQNAVLQPG